MAPFQLVDQLLAAVIREGFHVVEVYTTIAVERGRERLFGRIDVRNPVERERYGMVEDVGLDERPFFARSRARMSRPEASIIRSLTFALAFKLP